MSKSPEGPWSEPRWIAQGGIDPSLFWDDDGTAYFISTMPSERSDGSEGNGIFQAQICPDTGELLTESKKISSGCGGRFAEGPHMYKLGDWYYLLTAEGGTEFCHMSCIARSRSIWGPFEPCLHNPILTAVREHNPDFAGLGHGDIVQAHDGTWWIVFLGHRLTEAYYHHMGRETGIAPLEWIDGWPVVNKNKAPGLHIDIQTSAGEGKTETSPDMCCKNGGVDIYGNSSVRTLFDGKPLGWEWNFFRKFFDGYSMDERPGWLTLYGNKFTLDDKDTPAFIGRRIDNFEFRAEILMDYVPDKFGEAGIAIAHTPFVHYEFVLTRKDHVCRTLLRKRVFDMVTETWGEEVPEGPVKLQIIGDRYTLIFNAAMGDNDDYICAGTGTVKLLSSEVAGGCIGCYVGIYASTRGEDAVEKAHYRWFEYEWLPEKPDGTIGFPEGVDSSNSGYYLNATWIFGNQFLSRVWEGNDPDSRQIALEKQENALYSPAIGFTVDTSLFENELTSINNIIEEYRNGLISGVLDPETELPAFLEKLENGGMPEILQSCQQQYDEWKAQNQ